MASSCKEGYYFCNSSQKCKKIPRGHKVQSDGELVREYVSDWRSDLQETEAAMAKLQTADKKRLGIKDNPDNNPDIQKANNAILKKQGLGHSMTRTGKYINYGATVKSQFDKVTKETQKPEHKEKLKARGTSAAEMKKTGDDLAWRAEREVNRNIPDTFYHQAKGIENKIELNTAKSKADAKKGRFQNKVVKTEELQGGVSVEPYTKDTKFLEVETVDIIKPKALNASDWRSDLVQIDEKYKYLKTGNLKDMSKGKDEKAPVDYSKIRASKETKKEVVSASYELEGNNLAEAYLNEFNQLRDFVDEMVSAGCSSEEIYNCLIEEHELREDAVLKVLSEKGGFFKGAIDGLRKIPGAIKAADQFGRANAPKVWNFLKNVDSKARPIVKSGIEKTKRAITGADQWGRKNLPPAVERGKKDLKKVSDFTQQAYSSLEKNVGQPLLTKGKGDIAKWKKTQEVIRRANSLAKTKAEKAGQIVDIAPTTTNLPQAKKSLPLTKNVTKDMSPKEIRSKGMNLLAKLQGKTPKQQKAKELTNRMSKAVDSSKKPTTYSGQVDAALKKPDPGAIVKSSSSAVTAVKPSLDTTKGINMSLSSMASKVKNLLTGTKASKQITGTKAAKQITGTKATKQITGTKTPNVLTGTKTKQLELPISTKKKFNPAKAVKNTVVGVTGAAVGSNLLKKDKTTAVSPSKEITKDQPKIDPPNENKAIVDTEKKKVNPEKNPVVSKVVDTYDTGRKDTKSKNLNPWGRSKQYKAKDGTVVDRSDVFTKAAFDFGPNIKKGEKLGVMGHGQRKKYDLEATRRKSVKESVAVAKQLPKAFKAVSKLKNVAKSGAIQKVFGGASALTGLSGMVHQSKKDSIPDINSDAPPDIQKQLDAPQDVRPRSRGEKILKDLLGTKKDPKAMKDKYDKDALDNVKTDSILDPSGTQKTKPTLDQLRKDVKTRKKYKTKSPEIERNQGTMTDKQIERMKKAGLL